MEWFSTSKKPCFIEFHWYWSKAHTVSALEVLQVRCAQPYGQTCKHRPPPPWPLPCQLAGLSWLCKLKDNKAHLLAIGTLRWWLFQSLGLDLKWSRLMRFCCAFPPDVKPRCAEAVRGVWKSFFLKCQKVARGLCPPYCSPADITNPL